MTPSEGRGGSVPFHRYECEACGEKFRVLHRDENGSDDHSTCPHCGGMRARRLLPRIGVIYKGTGYYSTDYRNTRMKAAKTAECNGRNAAEGGGDRAAAAATTKAD